MTVTDDSWFSGHLGHRHRFDDGRAVVELPIDEQLCVPGTGAPRLAVLATVADIAAGSLVQPAIEPYVPMTIDLDMRRRSLAPVAHATGTASMVKQGGTICVTETVFVDTERPEQPIAHSVIRFMRSPSPIDIMPRRQSDYSGLNGSMTEPFAHQLRAKVPEPGVATLDRWTYVQQPTGTIQGGAIALLAELAAETALGAPVADVDVHFLSQVRIGPARAQAHPLWESSVRVEVRDEGNGGRLVALATARAVSQP